VTIESRIVLSCEGTICAGSGQRAPGLSDFTPAVFDGSPVDAYDRRSLNSVRTDFV